MADIAQLVVVVEDRSQVADARRQAQTLAAAHGLDEGACSRLSICVTETATNLIKHAERGRILLRSLQEDQGGTQVRGIEVMSVDKGPGIASLATSLRDGHSTAGSPGTGLGAISRQSTHFDLYSHAGKGTVLRFEIWPRSRKETQRTLESGVATWPKSGETECGDTCALVQESAKCTVLVADGLGHGPVAAVASRAATGVLAANPHDQPQALLEKVHGTIASTRGAAASVASIDVHTGAGEYCGVGNITGLVRADGKTRHLVSHNGTLGHNARRMQAFDFGFPPGALLILFSDGLTTHWSLDDYPGLEEKHPGLVAGVLARDHDRGRDDVTIVALRHSAG